jgi:AraC family transcriptional regulator
MSLQATIVEGELATPSLNVRLVNFVWDGPSELVYRNAEYALYRTLMPIPSRSRVSSDGSPVDFEGLGFWPGSTPLHFSTSRPSLRIAYCSFPAGRLESLTGFGDSWTVEDPRCCFALRNELLERLVLRLAGEIASPGFAAPVLVEGSGLLMAAEIARQLCGPPALRKARAGGLSPRQLRTITDYVADLDYKCPTVSELAALAGLSERHLLRAFKQATGITIKAHIEQVRTARACDLLRSDLPLKAIGARLGFSSSSHFAAAFRRATGHSPGDYRRNACA